MKLNFSQKGYGILGVVVVVVETLSVMVENPVHIHNTIQKLQQQGGNTDCAPIDGGLHRPSSFRWNQRLCPHPSRTPSESTQIIICYINYFIQTDVETLCKYVLKYFNKI